MLKLVPTLSLDNELRSWHFTLTAEEKPCRILHLRLVRWNPNLATVYSPKCIHSLLIWQRLIVHLLSDSTAIGREVQRWTKKKGPRSHKAGRTSQHTQFRMVWCTLRIIKWYNRIETDWGGAVWGHWNQKRFLRGRDIWRKTATWKSG